MGMKIIAFVLVFVLAAFSEARHTHPTSEQWVEETEGRVIDLKNDHDSAAIEAVNFVKPKSFYPFSSILFFKSYDPCEDGFKLDYQGICREVWF